MPETFRSVVQFRPSGFKATEAEFDHFSAAAYDTEEALPEVLECHVSADLAAQVIEVEFVVVAEDEVAATLNAEWICESIAHRADVLAGRATTSRSDTRVERLAPA